MKTIKIMAPALLALTIVGTATAQTGDESQVILPLEAQTCNLPVAPATIPADADYDAIVKAHGQVKTFQAEMLTYRECLDRSRDAGNLTEGNDLALVQAHNYSVEMEERIAEQFNVAVRSYKERKAQQEKAEG